MSGDLASQVATELAKTATSSRLVGIYRAAEGNLAVVDVNDSRIKVPMVGYQPYPDCPVWLDSQNGRMVCTGPSWQFSPYATVLTLVGQKVRVQVDDGPVLELPYRAGLTLTAGQRVEVSPVTRVVQGVLSVVPAPPVDPGGGTPGGQSFTGLLVQAIDSGTTNGGAYWQNNVNSDSNAGGAWFYGNQLRDALRGVVTFSSIEVYLPMLYSRFSVPTVRLHATATKPASGFPAFGSTFVPGTLSGWVAIPADWGVWMRDNPAGVGFLPTNGVLASWTGKAADAMSGAMRFSGRR